MDGLADARLHHGLGVVCSGESAISRHAVDSFITGAVMAIGVCVFLRGAPSVSTSSLLSFLAALAACIGLKDFIRYRADKVHYKRERAREEWCVVLFSNNHTLQVLTLFLKAESVYMRSKDWRCRARVTPA